MSGENTTSGTPDCTVQITALCVQSCLFVLGTVLARCGQGMSQKAKHPAGTSLYTRTHTRPPGRAAGNVIYTVGFFITAAAVFLSDTVVVVTGKSCILS